MKFSLLFFLFLLLSCNVAPGSYPYAERYEINLTETDIIQKINDFKIKNPEYHVPKEFRITDGKRTENDHWFHVYFYYKEKNIVVKTWIRSKSKAKTIFAFVGIKKYSENSKWKMINKDFDNLNNKNILDEFENRILKNFN
ncbi:hypothetical protein [uncultured Aquimarina sp.]|uniref:hypothetical protein n=1 Tax=uncultured Aquimarina sp. TaxID=575652 RepID=UPI00262A2BB7|nr:hypothetical protein [uncultured Aquimarina sp.]